MAMPSVGRLVAMLSWTMLMGCYRPIDLTAAVRGDSAVRLREAGLAATDAGASWYFDGQQLGATDAAERESPRLDGSASSDGSAASDGSASSDARAPDVPSGRDAATSRCQPRPIDLLIVLDSSPSMVEEQRALIATLRDFMGELVGGLGSDPDDPGVGSLQVGVVTSDLGNGGASDAVCTSFVGDDGLLSPRFARRPGCQRRGASEIVAGWNALSQFDVFADHASCLVEHVGTAGCLWGQPLEASLKALSPPEPPMFQFATGGHGLDADANLGFLREGSLLALLFITDRSDCSVVDPSSMEVPSISEAPPATCAADSPALQILQRYFSGFSQLRSPEDFAAAVLGGIPTGIEGASSREILDNPAMSEHYTGGAVAPSCSGPLGDAYPPRRLVEFASAWGEDRSWFESICAPDLQPGLRRIARGFSSLACVIP